MATRVLGPTGSKRRRRFLLVPILLVACTALFVIGGAQAVHDENVFQLDGNALKSLDSSPGMPSFPAGEDADNICAGHQGKSDGTNPVGEKCNIPLNGSFATPTASTRSSFVTDASGTFPPPPGTVNEDIYTSGSKDGSDISTWAYKVAGSSNDKSDIENAFAAFYTSQTGDKLVYFGGDRTSNSGDENTAFWFLQSPAAESPCANISGSGCPFTTDGKAAAADGSNLAHHVAANAGPDKCLVNPANSAKNINIVTGGTGCTETDPAGTDSYGDILVVSAFTGGGVQPNITAYEWFGANNYATGQGADKSLCGTSTCTTVKILDVTQGCSPITGSGDAGCAVTDQNKQYDTCPASGPCVIGQAVMPTASPWLFLEKSSDNTNTGANACQTAANKFCPGTYFEGGLNLTALGLQSECTSTFVMDTRSSQSVNSSLQDLAVGQVGSCGSTMSTTPKNGAGDTTAPDDPASASALSIGTGTVLARDQAHITVTGTDTWSGTLKFYLCGPIPAGDTCDGTTHVGLQIGSTMNVNQSSGTSDGLTPPGRLINSAQALLTSAANKSTGAPGHYCWRGVFAATVNGTDLGKTDASSGECFVVNPKKPTLTTQASCSATPCILGSTLSDTATLSGTATKPGTNPLSSEFPTIFQGSDTPTLAKAGGTINWKLYGPASDGTAQCTTQKTLTTSSASVINGNDTYPKTAPDPANQAPISYTTNPASDGLGVYTFAASYGGDNPNTLAADDVACSTQTPVTSEQVTVSSSASTSTTQKWLPQDTAHVTASGGATVAGFVVFQLFESTNCTGNAVQTFGNDPAARITVDSLGNATTNNTTYYVDVNVQISWKATFTSTNGVASGNPAPCERSDIANLDDDITTP
jgi:hypothetical protein